MLIAELLAGLPHRWTRGRDDREVDSIAYDSRKTGPGAVFVAMPGLRTDGLRCAPEAIGRGASAVVVGTGRSGLPELSGAPRVIEVEDERVALAVMARNLHGRVDETLTVVGLTGTNGKTTTCSLVAAILERAGLKTGVLGTVGHRVGDALVGAGLTTPEAPEIHGYLARMAGAGCRACVMEVSSIALDRKRVHGIRFAVAVFTNLTRDHLDYHKDMEAYFLAKRLLFEGLDDRAWAVVNVADPYGRRLVGEWGGGRRSRLTTYGTGDDAGIRLASMDMTGSGTRLELEEADRGETMRAVGKRTRHTVCTPLIGRFNAFNVAAAAAAARSLQVSWDCVIEGVASVASVPGRLERVVLPGRGQDFDVFVDYAHTDDALRVALETVRQVTQGRVIVVFGCGGDRDRSKRPLMGAQAERLADLAFVTSDNPRGEAPEAIIDEILAGMGGGAREEGGRVRADPDRRRAIEAAIASAGPGDAVVIAGKGHETYQIIGDRVTHFDDRDVARETLARVLS